MGRIVNKAELAEILALSLPAVDAMIRQGMPTISRGIGGAGGGFKIDVAKVIKWQIEQATRDISSQFEAVNLDEARLRKVAAEAALAELDLALKRGDAVSLASVAKRWEGMVTAFKYRCLAIPAKLAPALVAETDLVLARGMLEREIHEALDELTDYEPEAEIQDIAGRVGGDPADDQENGSAGEAAAVVDGEPVGRSLPDAKPGGVRRARRLEN